MRKFIAITISLCALCMCSFRAQAQWAVTDAAVLGATVEDAAMSAVNFEEVLKNFGITGDKMDQIIKGTKQVYDKANTIVSTTRQAKSLYDNMEMFMSNVTNNIELYKRYADEGWIDMSTLKMASGMTRDLSERAINTIGGFMDVFNNEELKKSFSASEWMNWIDNINKELMILNSGSDALRRIIEKSADKKKEEQAAEEAETEILESVLTANALEDYKNWLAKRKQIQSDINNKGALQTIVDAGGIQNVGSDIETNASPIDETKLKEAKGYINGLKGGTIKTIITLLLMLFAGTAVYAGIKVINGENQMMLLKTCIGFIVILVMLEVLSIITF